MKKLHFTLIFVCIRVAGVAQTEQYSCSYKSVFLTKEIYVFSKFCSHIERFWSENSFLICTCPYLNIIWRKNIYSLSLSLLMGKNISRIFKSLNMVVSKRFSILTLFGGILFFNPWKYDCKYFFSFSVYVENNNFFSFELFSIYKVPYLA